MKVESALAGFTPLGYTETITPHTFSCGISVGDGRFHDSRKGWGTFSSDGKSITWDHWRPPTPREIADSQFAIWWRTTELSHWADSEWAKWYDGWYAKQCAKTGTTLDRVRKTILDVIESAPPFSERFKAYQ